MEPPMASGAIIIRSDRNDQYDLFISIESDIYKWSDLKYLLNVIVLIPERVPHIHVYIPGISPQFTLIEERWSICHYIMWFGNQMCIKNKGIYCIP